MAALLLLLAIIGGIVVGDLVLRTRRDRPGRQHDEATSPAHLGFTASAASTAERRVTDASQRAERHSEPLYEEARRAARLRSDPDLSFLFTDEYARQWQTHEPVRRS
jgi:hypothetical protein